MEEVQIQDTELYQFRSIGNVNVGQKLPKNMKLNSHLLYSSNDYGFILIGKMDCFLFVETKNLYKMMKEKSTNTSDFTKVFIRDDKTLINIGVSSNGTTISAVTSNKIHLFDARSIMKEDTKSTKSFPFPEEIIQSSWSPSSPSQLLVVTADGKLVVINTETGNKNTVSSGGITAASWSPSGNQIASGHVDGTIAVHSYPVVSKIAQLPKPEDDLTIVNTIYWFEDRELAAVYKGKEDYLIYVMPFTPSFKPTQPFKYFLPQSTEEDSGDCTFYLKYISDWKILVVSASISSYIELLGKEGDEWKQFSLLDNFRAIIPLSQGDEESFPRGLVIDYTNKQLVPNNPNKDAKDNLEIPRPALLFLTTDGAIVGYHFIKTDAAKPHDFMIKPKLLEMPPLSNNFFTVNSSPVNSTPVNPVFPLNTVPVNPITVNPIPVSSVFPPIKQENNNNNNKQSEKGALGFSTPSSWSFSSSGTEESEKSKPVKNTFSTNSPTSFSTETNPSSTPSLFSFGSSSTTPQFTFGEPSIKKEPAPTKTTSNVSKQPKTVDRKPLISNTPSLSTSKANSKVSTTPPVQPKLVAKDVPPPISVIGTPKPREAKGTSTENISLQKQYDDQINSFNETLEKLRQLNQQTGQRIEYIKTSPNVEEFTVSGITFLKKQCSELYEQSKQLNKIYEAQKKKVEKVRSGVVDAFNQGEYARQLFGDSADPDYKLLQESRELDSESIDNRRKIRKRFEEIQSSIDQVSQHLQQLRVNKKKEDDSKRFSLQLKGNSMEAINRTLNNHYKLAKIHAFQIDQLTNQFNQIKLKSRGVKNPPRTPERTPFALAPTSPFLTPSNTLKESNSKRLSNIKDALAKRILNNNLLKIDYEIEPFLEKINEDENAEDDISIVGSIQEMIEDNKKSTRASKTHRPAVQSYTTRSASRTANTSAERAKASRTAFSNTQRFVEKEKSPLKRPTSSSSKISFSFEQSTPQTSNKRFTEPEEGTDGEAEDENDQEYAPEEEEIDEDEDEDYDEGEVEPENEEEEEEEEDTGPMFSNKSLKTPDDNSTSFKLGSLPDNKFNFATPSFGSTSSTPITKKENDSKTSSAFSFSIPPSKPESNTFSFSTPPPTSTSSVKSPENKPLAAKALFPPTNSSSSSSQSTTFSVFGTSSAPKSSSSTSGLPLSFGAPASSKPEFGKTESKSSIEVVGTTPMTATTKTASNPSFGTTFELPTSFGDNSKKTTDSKVPEKTTSVFAFGSSEKPLFATETKPEKPTETKSVFNLGTDSKPEKAPEPKSAFSFGTENVKVEKPPEKQAEKVPEKSAEKPPEKKADKPLFSLPTALQTPKTGESTSDSGFGSSFGLGKPISQVEAKNPFGGSIDPKTTTTTPNNSQGAPLSFGSSSSSFGSSSFGTSSFGSSTTQPSSTSTPSVFGSNSSQPSTSTSSAFGSSTTQPSSSSAPSVFGSSSSQSSSFGSSTSQPTFGAPSFGTNSTSTNAFGSNTGSFGTPSSTFPTSTSAFGTSPSNSVFGSASAFGSSTTSQPSTTSVFGTPTSTSAFGNSSTPAFGTTTPVNATPSSPFTAPTPSFGQTNPPNSSFSAPPSSTTGFGSFGAPSFGSTSAPSFGQTAFGATSFGSASPLGNSTSFSSQTQSSQPGKLFGSGSTGSFASFASTSPATFGSSTPGNQTGFGSLGNNTQQQQSGFGTFSSPGGFGTPNSSDWAPRK